MERYYAHRWHWTCHRLLLKGQISIWIDTDLKHIVLREPRQIGILARILDQIMDQKQNIDEDNRLLLMIASAVDMPKYIIHQAYSMIWTFHLSISLQTFFFKSNKDKYHSFIIMHANEFIHINISIRDQSLTHPSCLMLLDCIPFYPQSTNTTFNDVSSLYLAFIT